MIGDSPQDIVLVRDGLIEDPVLILADLTRRVSS
jgi:hypothetical protein